MKKNFVALAVAGFLCCFAVFSISCGEGTITELNKDNVWDAEQEVGIVVDNCFIDNSSGEKEFCDSMKEAARSSESDWEPSSESGGGEPSSNSDRPSSESGGGEPSSNSDGPSSNSSPSSSSANAPSSNSTPSSSSPQSSSSRPSSNSGGGGGNCESGQSAGNIAFTCAWSPRSVVSGKKTKPVIEISSPEGGNGCNSKISLAYQAGLGFGTVVFNEGTEYSTGSNDSLAPDGNSSRKFGWPVPTSSKDETLDIRASVTCGNSCKEIECPLTLTASPKPIVNGDIICNWRLLSGNGNNKYLSKGAEIPVCKDDSDISIENPGEDDADCGEVTYENSGSTSTVGKVYGRAVATCSGSKVTLKEYEAEVVEDPALGACTWKDNKTTLAKEQDAIPSAELSNSYGRCGEVKFSGGFPKKLTEDDVSDNVKVTASADCGDKGTIEKECPDLKVVSASYAIAKLDSFITVPNGPVVIEMDLPANWKPDGTATFACQVDRNGGDGKVSGKIGSVTMASQPDYGTAQIPVAWTTGKYSLQVDLTCNNSCKCKIGW